MPFKSEKNSCVRLGNFCPDGYFLTLCFGIQKGGALSRFQSEMFDFTFLDIHITKNQAIQLKEQLSELIAFLDECSEDSP